MVLTIDQTIQQLDFDYNYKSIYGENNKINDNGDIDNDDDDDDGAGGGGGGGGGNIADIDNQNIASFRYYEDLDNTNDKAYILPISKPIGQVTGLGINSHGYLLAFHKADRTWNKCY
uniref:Bm8068 n=1 Tax=Brugia malayi TaxID=6279 RepID=A0A0H5SDH7_BRUMA|nr:Bm8068 [Brugia malayi]